MVGYVCKYTPYLILENFGEGTVRIEPRLIITRYLMP